MVLVIELDFGLFKVDPVATDPLDWLPLVDLPSNVKIIISVDSSIDAFHKIKSTLDASCLFEVICA